MSKIMDAIKQLSERPCGVSSAELLQQLGWAKKANVTSRFTAARKQGLVPWKASSRGVVPSTETVQCVMDLRHFARREDAEAYYKQLLGIKREKPSRAAEVHVSRPKGPAYSNEAPDYSGAVVTIAAAPLFDRRYELPPDEQPPAIFSAHRPGINPETGLAW